MDWMQKALGGRKFVMALIIIGAGIFLELHRAEGISMNMAGLLAGILATFSAANSMVSTKHMSSQVARRGPSEQEIEQGQQLIGVLSQLGKDLQEVKANASMTSQILVNMSQPPRK